VNDRSPAVDVVETVVVATGEGARFHRPGPLVFAAACKTEFERPVRELSVVDALREGFTPCEKPDCFGDAFD
jgi:hypothetical protein